MAKAQRFSIGIDDLRAARGKVESLSFHGDSPEALASQLQTALQQSALFDQWRAMQPDPDDVDPSLGATDPSATVSARQTDMNCAVQIMTTLPHAILKHRLTLLVGSHWTLRDVSAA